MSPFIKNKLSIIAELDLSFHFSAVATYFPKRKVDKKKSLLGSPKDSDESKPEAEVMTVWKEILYTALWYGPYGLVIMN